MQSDDLIERGSELQSEQVFGTNELRYELVRQKADSISDLTSVKEWF